MSNAPDRPTIRRGLRLIGRALRLRCPNCGGADVFQGWFTMRERCPTCGLELARTEEGYLVGSYMLNIAVSEGTWLLAFLLVLVAMWPDPPWTALLYGSAVLIVLAPIAFYPFSKTLFLALDLAIRPKGSE